MDSLVDYNDRTDYVVDYYWQTALFAAGVASEVPGQPYAGRPSRTGFAGFSAGYMLMRELSTMLDVTSDILVDSIYEAGDLFLNRTYLGPFHEFCRTANDTLCFCNTALHTNKLFSLDPATGKYYSDLVYENMIQEDDVPIAPGYWQTSR